MKLHELNLKFLTMSKCTRDGHGANARCVSPPVGSVGGRYWAVPLQSAALTVFRCADTDLTFHCWSFRGVVLFQLELGTSSHVLLPIGTCNASGFGKFGNTLLREEENPPRLE